MVNKQVEKDLGVNRVEPDYRQKKFQELFKLRVREIMSELEGGKKYHLYGQAFLRFTGVVFAIESPVGNINITPTEAYKEMKKAIQKEIEFEIKDNIWKDSLKGGMRAVGSMLEQEKF